MGSCASVSKDASNRAMTVNTILSSRKEKMVGRDSFLKHNSPCDFKDENFFDSQPWIESDCEDDFFSVNGDFTPSCGNTPVHCNFSSQMPNTSTSPLDNSTQGPKSEPLPAMTKKLSELFHESEPACRGPGRSPSAEITSAIAPGTPFSSGTASLCSSQRTPNGDSFHTREKSIRKAFSCCLSGSISYPGGLTRRRKKT